MVLEEVVEEEEEEAESLAVVVVEREGAVFKLLWPQRVPGSAHPHLLPDICTHVHCCRLPRTRNRGWLHLLFRARRRRRPFPPSVLFPMSVCAIICICVWHYMQYVLIHIYIYTMHRHSRSLHSTPRPRPRYFSLVCVCFSLSLSVSFPSLSLSLSPPSTQGDRLLSWKQKHSFDTLLVMACAHYM